MNDQLYEKLQSFVGQPAQPPYTAPDQVSRAAIRRWVEAIGDTNPIYIDDTAARAAGRPGVVAPPAMLGVWTMRGYRDTRHPPPNATRGALGALADAGYPTTPGTNLQQQYTRELVPGDQLSTSTGVSSVSERKRTSRGFGYFVAQTSTFTDQNDAVVGTQTLTVFAFRPFSANAAAKPVQPPQLSTSTALPALEIALDRLGVIACTTACNDFRAGHYDHDVARAIGFTDIFTDIPTSAGFVARYVSEWAGPRSRLRSLDIRLGVPFFAGDTLRLTGTIAADGPESVLQIIGMTSNGVHVSGTATIDRESRS